MKKTVIFDLDGTLVNIEPIFLKILNTLAPEFGYAPLRPDEIPTLKQRHLKNLIWEHLGWRMIFFPKILARGREEYQKLVPKVELFPGIEELLSTLHDRGCRIGIVSSSREDTIRSLISKHGLPVDFFYQSGLFNKDASLKNVLRKEHAKPDETLYVGDEVRDIEACQKIGLEIIAVTWGLNSKEALEKAGAETSDTPEELLARLLK